MPVIKPDWQANIVDKVVDGRRSHGQRSICEQSTTHENFVVHPLSLRDEIVAMIEGYQKGADPELLRVLLDRYKEALRRYPDQAPSYHRSMPALIFADGSSYIQHDSFYDELLDLFRNFDVFEGAGRYALNAAPEELKMIHVMIRVSGLRLEWQLFPRFVGGMISELRENADAIRDGTLGVEEIADIAKAVYTKSVPFYVHPLRRIDSPGYRLALYHEAKIKRFEFLLENEPEVWASYPIALTQQESDQLFLEVTTSDSSDLPSREEFDEYLKKAVKKAKRRMVECTMAHREPILRANLELSRMILRALRVPRRG